MRGTRAAPATGRRSERAGVLALRLRSHYAISRTRRPRIARKMQAMQQEQQAGAPGTARFALADNPAQGRYELKADGELAAWAEYLRSGDALCFIHTEVKEAYEGQGLA